SGAALLEPGTAVVDLLLGGEGIDGGDVLDGVPVADGIRDRGLLGVGEGRVTAEDGGAADAAGLGDLGLERLEDRLEAAAGDGELVRERLGEEEHAAHRQRKDQRPARDDGPGTASAPAAYSVQEDGHGQRP